MDMAKKSACRIRLWTRTLACLICFCTAATAAPPQLYRQAAYEGPVRGDPDDLLMLPGYGFAADDRVVYQAVTNTTKGLTAPRQLPSHSTADFGFAEVVSTANLPYSLTVKLPQVLRRDQSYALWVRTSSGEWSQAVTINDARPLWISPAYVYATKSLASLPRELKVVGRNLQPSPGHVTQIRLIGPQLFVAATISDARSSATIDHYVARLQLPDSLAPGRYRIQVSRDATSWVEVPEQQLEVRPDPPLVTEYPVSDAQFGNCRPNDDADDTTCIVRAIAAAKRAGGGTVYFGPGTWDLVDSALPGLVVGEGILVADGASLKGAGKTETRLVRHGAWNERAETAAFTLIGHNVVSGFTFHDLQVYHPHDRAGPFLQLGEFFQRVSAAAMPGAASVYEVTITGNVFDRTYVAIGDGGMPIDRLFITYNIFGAYSSALELGGNRFNMAYKFRLDDSVISYNTFKPSSYLVLAEKVGVIASEIGAGRRVDFSHNTADGSSADYLYSPQDARGWRAAFFWHMNNNQEMLLVSQNVATCTGDKIGDGEAIAYDNNGNTFALTSVLPVVRATGSSVAVSGQLATRQNSRDVPIASYYIGHWVQVASGPGLGQVRKITGYSTDPVTQLTTFSVAPDWDVLPTSGQTRIAVGREFWQLYTLDNLVDHRQPLCQKSNRSRHDGGGIGLWAQSADSVIEGNRQYDTDGILFQQNYIVAEHPCTNCTMGSFFHSFLEIRANTIDGEYDWDIDCSASGIAAGVAAAPWGDASPPTVGYGVSISHNTIRHADAVPGGAITQMESWYSGPEPHRWPLSDNMLIYHNLIQDIEGPRATPKCASSHPRMGITFPHSDTAWHTVLYANSCSHVSVPIGSGGVDIVRVCPSSATDSCECAP
jgi:hypothetical protein